MRSARDSPDVALPTEYAAGAANNDAELHRFEEARNFAHVRDVGDECLFGWLMRGTHTPVLIGGGEAVA